MIWKSNLNEISEIAKNIWRTLEYEQDRHFSYEIMLCKKTIRTAFFKLLHRQYDLEVWSFGTFSNIAICTWRPVDSCFLHCMNLNYPGKVILIPAPLLRTKGTGCSLRRLQLPVSAGQWHPLRCCTSPFFHRRLQH